MNLNRRRWGALLGATCCVGVGTTLGWALAGRTPAASAGTPPPSTRHWTCPMHPQVDRNGPGSCPICGMDLVLREATGDAQAEAAPIVHLSEQVQQNSGVRTAAVELRELSPRLWVTGQMLADERRAVSVAPKVEGWIRRLGVTGVGHVVQRGQMLYEIYSPDLQLRQREYVEILSRRDLLQAQAGSMKASVGSVSPDMMMGSVARERFRMRSRLLAADMPEALIDQLESDRRVREVVPVLAQRDGIVTAMSLREGAYAMPSQVVLEYADLQPAWVEVQLTPEQLGQLRPRSQLQLRSSVQEGEVLALPVDGRQAVINPSTRMARLRLPLHQAARAFPTGAPVQGEILVPGRRVPAIPRDAVIHTGAGSFVFVQTEPQHYEQRPVRVGPALGPHVEVLDGLAPGEQLVVNGQFLLSAELGSRSPPAAVSGATARTPAPPAMQHGAP
ncbi:efflux RND transporter periplasmic adaptor subunit [Mitsuaria sp. WAJ17]|uniref:efflux RND transporter periplasmic adaptor subunit n=1 Tax=Mitsuaria sp. WAJ17 TaxID=2761452 RepID=UPI001600F2D5|nr:efflux RND transporter periplasmic adaptor subunit [Mitsuaria sp. WAJ17]MBB2485025.1 efflux RND transporter periplasmic adaptor subunit [Mitsuaria sp. WAJ17]